MESESTLFFLNPNPDSYFLALNPNPNPNPAQKALNPDSNPDSDSHITGTDLPPWGIMIEIPGESAPGYSGSAHREMGAPYVFPIRLFVGDIWGDITHLS